VSLKLDEENFCCWFVGTRDVMMNEELRGNASAKMLWRESEPALGLSSRLNSDGMLLKM
jgi:hypothetical protein